jgi:tripartite ATP-independent transporter DctM subunit
VAAVLAAVAGAGMSALLCRAGIELVRLEREAGGEIALGIPIWLAQAVMPAALALIALRLAWRAPGWSGRLLAGVGVAGGLLLARFPQVLDGHAAWPWVGLLAAAALLGTPIFAVLGGAAALLFLSRGVEATAVLSEAYGLSVSPTLPAIPLFTLAGFLLAEGRAPGRLLRVFRAWVGWMPGGTAVVTAALCAFFTAFTGGSGVTILALGGILLPALLIEGYRQRFSLGLLTASGSLGLLFPPALPLILYGIVAEQPLEDLFLGGLLPGVLLVVLLAAWGVREGIVSAAQSRPFAWREALAASWAAKWELAIPIVALGAILSGLATPVEAAALTALYTLISQCFIQRDLSVTRDAPRVMAECATLLGAILIILAMAKGLAWFLIFEQAPMVLLGWVAAHVASRWLFLLGLNLFLLVVGCLMDIFSAIVVVVPLILPLAAAFGVDPVHLGIIFIANLELGYLTPPVGLNLFLASYRFDRPLLEIWRAALVPLAILGIGVLVITYVPWLTGALLAEAP